MENPTVTLFVNRHVELKEYISLYRTLDVPKPS